TQVPAHGPFAFAVAVGPQSRPRCWPFDGVGDAAAAPLRLAPFAPTVVTAELVDEDGAPVAARVRLQSWADCRREERERLFAREGAMPAADGHVRIETTDRGLALAAILPDDAALRPRLCWLTL